MWRRETAPVEQSTSQLVYQTNTCIPKTPLEVSPKRPRCAIGAQRRPDESCCHMGKGAAAELGEYSEGGIRRKKHDILSHMVLPSVFSGDGLTLLILFPAKS